MATVVEPRTSRPLVHAHRSSELCVVAGSDRQEMLERVGALRGFLAAAPDVALAAVAEALNRETAEGSTACLAVVAATTADLADRLARIDRALKDDALLRLSDRQGGYFAADGLARTGQVAVMFPGEGSQYRGMLAQQCCHFDVVRRRFDRMDAVFGGLAPGAADGGDHDPWEMRRAVLAVVSADLAMHELLGSLGLRADAVVGHSSGEYVALLAAGAVRPRSDDALLDLVAEGDAVTAAVLRDGLVPRAELLALGNADRPRLDELLAASAGRLHIAMDNCPHQVVMCGFADDLAGLAADLGPTVIRQRLPFSRPYHTPLFARARDRLAGFFATLPLQSPERPLYSCATASRMPDDVEALRAITLDQWVRPVRFAETVSAMWDDGCRAFVEVGPGAKLASFVRDTLGGRPHLAVATDHESRGTDALHHALGTLVAHGARLNLSALFEGRVIDSLPAGAVWEVPTLGSGPGKRLRLGLPRLAAPGLAPPLASTAVPSEAPAPARSNGDVPDTAPPAVGAAPPVAAYFETMERFVETQRAVFGAALADGRGASSASTLRGPQEPTPARSAAVIRHVLGLDQQPWLRDHTLGPRVSADARLTPLPVVPLAVTVELMAAAAADVLGEPVARVEDLQATAWITLAHGPRELEVRARHMAARRVEVTVQALGDQRVVARAIVGAGAGSEVAEAAVLANAGPPRWGPDELYAEGARHGMFHGPAFRGVVAVERVGRDGADALVRTDLPLPPELSLSGSHTAPGLIDAAGQVLGFWTAEHLAEAFVVFPSSCTALCMHRRPTALPARARVRVRVRDVSATEITADMRVEDDAGAVLLSVHGWTARRHRLPEEFYAFRLDPAGAALGSPWPEALEPGSNGQAVHVALSPELLTVEQGIWEATLAHLALGRAERARWSGLERGRRVEWLLGRVAAKDAVRAVLGARDGARPYPADIEIAADDLGRPVAKLDGGTAGVHISIAHAGGVAAAVAVPAHGVAGVGIDVEPVRDISAAASAAFEPDERALLSAGAAGEVWELRAWCAKEAAAKALGQGLRHGPTALKVIGLDEAAGRVTVRPGGRLLDAFPALRDTRVLAQTVRENGLVAATAIHLEEP
jgi:malonyl CoA-acyl carrier protein transacylase/phosphopantetheinyl transferase